jgi:type II secretory pathway pseudopilin PulG
MRSAQRGFSLIETTIATGLLAGALVGLAQLLAISVENNATARRRTIAVILAEQKMEQLRALTWEDTTTDTTVAHEPPMGGTGLSPSPAGTLQQNTNGYVDYLDANGVQLGGGTAEPVGTAYIRRWSLEPLPTNPDNTLVIQVFVMRVLGGRHGDTGDVTHFTGHARLTTAKTRRGL